MKREISVVLCPASFEKPRMSEASILPFADGRLFLAYTEYYGGDWEDGGPAHIMGRWSPDGGETWSEPFVVQENIGRLNCMEASLVALPSGRVLLSFLRKDRESVVDENRKRTEEGLLHIMVKHSDDGCATWSEPIDVSRGEGYWCGTNDRLLRLSSGRLLIPAARGFAHAWLSDDDGASWRLCRGPLPPDDVAEPVVAELADGSLRMFLRTRTGNIFVARSHDGGENWGELDKWGPAGAAAPCIVRRVPGSEDLLMVWDNHPIRTNFTAAVSRDGGRIWENYRILEEQRTWPLLLSHAYPSLAFSDGNAHLTYWETHWAGREKRLFHLVYRRLPISWFYEEIPRREPAFDVRRKISEVFYADTTFDGEKRPAA